MMRSRISVSIPFEAAHHPLAGSLLDVPVDFLDRLGRT
jgi:hypothetical protein